MFKFLIDKCSKRKVNRVFKEYLLKVWYTKKKKYNNDVYIQQVVENMDESAVFV